jgi:hypothetical protein
MAPTPTPEELIKTEPKENYDSRHKVRRKYMILNTLDEAFNDFLKLGDELRKEQQGTISSAGGKFPYRLPGHEDSPGWLDNLELDMVTAYMAKSGWKLNVHETPREKGSGRLYYIFEVKPLESEKNQETAASVGRRLDVNEPRI